MLDLEVGVAIVRIAITSPSLCSGERLVESHENLVPVMVLKVNEKVGLDPRGFGLMLCASRPT
jgi:hypothetical protein